MISTLEYIQLKAFARQEGTVLGLIWLVSFACYLGNFYNSLLGLIAIGLALFTPFFVAIRLKKFKEKSISGALSFRRALAFCMLCFFYASLLFALLQYIYFAFIDKGFLVQQYNIMFSTPEAKQLMSIYKIKNEVESGVSTFGQLSPIEKSLNFLSMNITAGILMSFPIAALMKSTIQNKDIKQ